MHDCRRGSALKRITLTQLVAQNGVDKVFTEFNRNFQLPVFCENNAEPVDLLISNNPYSLWSLIRYDESGKIKWFISHWTDVEFTSLNTGETFTVNGGKEKY